MAVKTKAQIHAEINTLLANNISGDISAGDVRTPLHDIVDSYFDAPYKKYVVNLDQSGTSAPTPTVLENTLGGAVVWSYDGVGNFAATSAGAFPTKSKVIILLGQTYTTQTDENTYAYWGDANTIYVETVANNLSANGVLNNSSIEIRVYA